MSQCYEHFGIVRLTKYNSHLFVNLFIIILVLTFFFPIGFPVLDRVIVVLKDHTCLFNLNFYIHTQIYISSHMLESVILWYINIFFFFITSRPICK